MKKDKLIIPEINILKGIAIVCVVLFHMYPPLSRSTGHFWSYFRNIIDMVQMPTFMFASGFLYGFSGSEILSKSDYYAFVKKKFKRLMIPYLTVSLIIFFIKYLVGFFVTLKYPVDQNFWKYIIFHPYEGFATFLWFIYVLFIIFLIFPIMKKYLKNSYILFLLILMIYFIPLPGYVYFNLDLVRTQLVFFYIGYLYATNRERSLNIHPKYLCLFFTIIFGFLYIKQAVFWDSLGQFMAYRLTNLLFGISGMISLYYLSVLLSKKKNLLFYIFNIMGVYVAAIYLLHTIPMGLVSLCLQQYFKLSGYLFILIVSLIFISGTVLPMLSAKYIIDKSWILSFLILGVNKRYKS